jgi:hypothetical protein
VLLLWTGVQYPNRDVFPHEGRSRWVLCDIKIPQALHSYPSIGKHNM